jgi:Zn-finger nucleic acid-binding protein
MHCPTCTTTPLVLAERQGIEIDYCPACRGVWLDRGELDKLVERALDARPEALDHLPLHTGPHPRGIRPARRSWLREIFD